jgi:hypothetical protein
MENRIPCVAAFWSPRLPSVIGGGRAASSLFERRSMGVGMRTNFVVPLLVALVMVCIILVYGQNAPANMFDRVGGGTWDALRTVLGPMLVILAVLFMTAATEPSEKLIPWLSDYVQRFCKTLREELLKKAPPPEKVAKKVAGQIAKWVVRLFRVIIVFATGYIAARFGWFFR